MTLGDQARVLDEVRRLSVPLAALLAQTDIAYEEDGAFVFRFPARCEFHMTQFMEERNLQVVKEALSVVFGGEPSGYSVSSCVSKADQQDSDR